MDNNKIGKFIAHLRREKGLTQQQLGEKLFVTDKAVSKWERGLSLPDITLLEKLAYELEVDVSEILQGKRGKKKNIDIQEEINRVIAEIEEQQHIKKLKLQKKIKIVLIVILSIAMITILSFRIRYKYYHPSVIKEGNNHYEFGFYGKYNVEKNGLDEISKIMNITENRNNEKTNIDYLFILLDKNGNLEKFNITVYYFNNDLEYTGSGSYMYENHNLHYEYFEKSVNDYSIVKTYSKSNNVDYLSSYIKKIPINDQIKLISSDDYFIELNDKKYITKDTCVFDMRDNNTIKALSMDDYNNCLGGMISNGLYFSINMNDKLYYIIDTLDGDIKQVDFNMETDYYITINKELLFTRDYGVSWIKADISSIDIEKTLEFYRDISLQNGSWFISTNELIPIAYFYGESPKLKISNDNGITWNEKTFDLVDEAVYKNITHRIVGFTDQNFGYVALGTDWTMGSGEYKKAYITKNGGVDWTDLELPENHTINTLTDFIMLDENKGIVLLNNNDNINFPYMYITKDGGKNWKKVEYEQLIPNDVFYISNIDNIEKEGNEYTIILSQGDWTTTKVKLTSSDLINWQYDSTFTRDIHTVG